MTDGTGGPWARGIANRFMADYSDAPAGYPHLHHLTAPVRSAAVEAGDPQVAHLWAGEGFSHIVGGPAREITRTLASC